MDAGIIIGVDEVGRGPLAGPVVAGAVALMGADIAGLDDSKRLAPAVRRRLAAEIHARCHWAVAEVGPAEIDRGNILIATLTAMTRAVAALAEAIGAEPELVIVDGNITPLGRDDGWRWRCWAIVGGDRCEPAISAAAIVAKVHRDTLMARLAEAHPVYGWERNAGYGTPEHLAALRRHGACVHHRASFAPVAALSAL